MALRNIRINGDEILRKVSKPVKVINENIINLLDDMRETMEESNGLGIAAVQVGVLRRVVLVDVRPVDEQGNESEESHLIELINPVVVEAKGTQEKSEGCLSVPQKSGVVERPAYVKVTALNRQGQPFTVEATGLQAIAICHELDHLDGILFIDRVKELEDDEEE